MMNTSTVDNCLHFVHNSSVLVAGLLLEIKFFTEATKIYFLFQLIYLFFN